MSPDTRLQVFSAMAMSTSVEAHAIASMGLATMCNAPDVNLPLVAQVALPSLLRLLRAQKTDTIAACLDALSMLAELPQVQVDLVRMGATRTLLERASMSGA
eukprot:1369806-Prymnesium_polylepis.1